MPRGRPVGSKDKTPRKLRGKKVMADGCNCAAKDCKGECKGVDTVDTASSTPDNPIVAK
jgi:hypothetical protein